MKLKFITYFRAFEYMNIAPSIANKKFLKYGNLVCKEDSVARSFRIILAKGCQTSIVAFENLKNVARITE